MDATSPAEPPRPLPAAPLWPGRPDAPVGPDHTDELAVTLSSLELSRGARMRLAHQLGTSLARAATVPAALARQAAVVTSAVNRLSIRDLETLCRTYRRPPGDLLADRLITAAGRAGKVLSVGGVAAGLTPLPKVAVEGSRTVAAALIQIRLVGELHVAYGRDVPGERRAITFTHAWLARELVDPGRPVTPQPAEILAQLRGIIIGRSAPPDIPAMGRQLQQALRTARPAPRPWPEDRR
jgi:hypothetical protein